MWSSWKLKADCVRAFGELVRRLTICEGDLKPEDVLQATHSCIKVEEILFETATDSVFEVQAFVQAMPLREKPLLSSLELDVE